MGTKMVVAFANIFRDEVETKILNQSALKPLFWERYVDDVFSIWNIHKDQVTQFIELANKHHQTIKFTAEISYTKITFLDSNVFKGERFAEKSILDIETQFKPTETFQNTHLSGCHPQGGQKGFIKGEALRLLRTNSSENGFKTKILHFRARLIIATLLDIKFENRNQALLHKCKEYKRTLAFVTQYRSTVPNLKRILMQK